MQYYSDNEMKEIRIALENEILNWENVTTKKMFGCPCYKANNRLFGFIVTNGVVLTKLSETEREEIVNKFQAEPFQAGKRTVEGWPKVKIINPNEIDMILPYLRKSYHNAFEKK